MALPSSVRPYVYRMQIMIKLWRLAIIVTLFAPLVINICCYTNNTEWTDWQSWANKDLYDNVWPMNQFRLIYKPFLVACTYTCAICSLNKHMRVSDKLRSMSPMSKFQLPMKQFLSQRRPDSSTNKQNSDESCTQPAQTCSIHPYTALL